MRYHCPNPNCGRAVMTGNGYEMPQDPLVRHHTAECPSCGTVRFHVRLPAPMQRVRSSLTPCDLSCPHRDRLVG